MKRLISYSVWGNRKVYNDGILANIEDAKIHYPGWTCRVYCSIEAPVYPKLQEKDCEVVPVQDRSWFNLMRRFYSAALPDIDCCIFRDADGRLSDREAKAVNEWLASDKALHVMHDNVAHYGMPIGGGTWGIRGGWLPCIERMCECWTNNQVKEKDFEYGMDETFLREVIWPMFKYGNYMGHSLRSTVSTWGDNELPFPPHDVMKYGNFVGQKIQAEESHKIPKFFRKLN